MKEESLWIELGKRAADRAILDISIQRLTEFVNSSPSKRLNTPGKISDLKNVIIAATVRLEKLDRTKAPEKQEVVEGGLSNYEVKLKALEKEKQELETKLFVLRERIKQSFQEGSLADGRGVVKLGEKFYIEARSTT